jgi:hypothetical protein
VFIENIILSKNIDRYEEKTILPKPFEKRKWSINPSEMAF